MVSPMYIPIFRKILSILYSFGSLRTSELLAKMPEEPKSSFYNAMKKLEDDGFIEPSVRLKKLVIYNLTENGICVVSEYFDKNEPKDIIGAITQSDNYDGLFYSILVRDVKRRIGVDIGDGVYKELVKKNYELFLKKMRENLECLTRDNF